MAWSDHYAKPGDTRTPLMIVDEEAADLHHRRSQDYAGAMDHQPRPAAPNDQSPIVAPSNRRYMLPAESPKALTWLTADELETLLIAVQGEQRRRAATSAAAARKRPARPTLPPKGPRPKVGQINAIRAALRAGLTPAAVAKQFGVSKAVVVEVAAEPAALR